MGVVGELPARVEIGIPLIAGEVIRGDDGAVVLPLEWGVGAHELIPVRVGVGSNEPHVMGYLDPCDLAPGTTPMQMFAAALREIADALEATDG